MSDKKVVSIDSLIEEPSSAVVDINSLIEEPKKKEPSVSTSPSSGGAFPSGSEWGTKQFLQREQAKAKVENKYPSTEKRPVAKDQIVVATPEQKGVRPTETETYTPVTVEGAKQKQAEDLNKIVYSHFGTINKDYINKGIATDPKKEQVLREQMKANAIPEDKIESFIRDANLDYQEKLGEESKKSEIQSAYNFEKELSKASGIPASDEQVKERAANIVAEKIIQNGVRNLEGVDAETQPLVKEYYDLRKKISSTEDPDKRAEMSSRIYALDSKIKTLRDEGRTLYDPVTGKDNEVRSKEYTEMVEMAENKIKKTPQDKIMDVYEQKYHELNALAKLVGEKKQTSLGNYSMLDLAGRDAESTNLFFPNMNETQREEVRKAQKLADSYRTAKADFDAVNRFVLLNEDPSTVKRGIKAVAAAGTESFLEGFGKEDYVTDTEQVQRFVKVANEEGIQVKESDVKRAESIFLEKAVGIAGSLMPTIVEFTAMEMASGGLGTTAEAARVFSKLEKLYATSKTRKFAFETLKSGLEQSAKFSAVSNVFGDENVSGAAGFGGGVAESIASNILKVNKKFAPIFKALFEKGAEVVGQTLGEVGESFAEEFVGAGGNIKDAFKNTMGRTYDDKLDNIMLAVISSTIIGSAASTAKLVNLAHAHYTNKGDLKRAAEVEEIAAESNVEITKPTTSDKENKPGVQSSVGEGKEPVIDGPVTPTSEEATSTDRVLQKEGEVKEPVEPIEPSKETTIFTPEETAKSFEEITAKSQEVSDLGVGGTRREGNRELAEKRRALMEADPTVNKVYTNLKEVYNQLSDKGVLTKKGDC